MQAALDNELRLAVPMDVRNLADLRWRTWSYLAAAEVPGGMIEDILIALHEAVANSLRHSGARADIAVRVQAQPTKVVVEVSDNGRGIDPAVTVPPAAPEPLVEGGRGLFLIWSLMSSVWLGHHSGVHLIMVKELFPTIA